MAHRWNLVLAALVLITCAWFGVGHSSEDEFQHVILVAEHLRGNMEADAMPIDFQRAWRSNLLPVIAAGVFEACAAIGISNPFTLTLLLRLITAVLALWVMHGLVRAVKPELRTENHQALDALSWFLWFVPVLLIRFSGEAWSALLFARGLSLLLGEKPRSPWAIGAWWGAAVICRPAVALLPVAAMLWLLLVKKESRSRLLRIVGGGAAAIAIGIGVDAVAYGTFTVALWNYGLAAMTGEEAWRFTVLPWYQHVLFIVKYATPPVALMLFGACAVLVLLKPKHILVWLILPFLMAHSFMPIKEPRFLFPLAPLMPWLLVAAWDALWDRWPVTMKRDLWLRLLFPFAAINLLALVVAALTPAGNGRVALAKEIRTRFGDERVRIDLIGDWRQWIPPFYLSAGSTETITEKVVPAKSRSTHLVLAPESRNLDSVVSMERLATGCPGWTHRYLRWYGLEDSYDPLVLYQVKIGVLDH
ncbi:MAG: hypothetical protein IPK70_06045 [Flavobacteriales bacterium]|jgi:phosphatidylinositol glycan class B|nr:hypothetical protein [Flavobacteriales bacterium]